MFLVGLASIVNSVPLCRLLRVLCRSVTSANVVSQLIKQIENSTCGSRFFGGSGSILPQENFKNLLPEIG